MCAGGLVLHAKPAGRAPSSSVTMAALGFKVATVPMFAVVALSNCIPPSSPVIRSEPQAPVIPFDPQSIISVI